MRGSCRGAPCIHGTSRGEVGWERVQSASVELRLPERCAAVAVTLTGRVQLAVGSGERFQDLLSSQR